MGNRARVGDWEGTVRVDYEGSSTTLHFQGALPDPLVTDIETRLAEPDVPAWVELPDYLADECDDAETKLSARQKMAANGWYQTRYRLRIVPTADTLPPPIRQLIVAYEADDTDLPDLLPTRLPGTDGPIEVKPPEYRLEFHITEDSPVTGVHFVVKHPRPRLHIDY